MIGANNAAVSSRDVGSKVVPNFAGTLRGGHIGTPTTACGSHRGWSGLLLEVLGRRGTPLATDFEKSTPVTPPNILP